MATSPERKVVWEISDPAEYERLTCTHCKRRRRVARWYTVLPGPCFPVCSECKELEPVEGRDYFIEEPEDVPIELSRAVMEFFNPGSGALLDVG